MVRTVAFFHDYISLLKRVHWFQNQYVKVDKWVVVIFRTFLHGSGMKLHKALLKNVFII